MRTCACVRVRCACTCRAPGEQSWRLIGAFLSVHTVQDLAARDGPRRRSRALRPLQKVPLPLSPTAPHSTALSRYHRCRRIDRLRRGFAHESAAQGVALRFKSPTDLASCGWNVRRAVLGSGRATVSRRLAHALPGASRTAGSVGRRCRWNGNCARCGRSGHSHKSCSLNPNAGEHPECPPALWYPLQMLLPIERLWGTVRTPSACEPGT